MIDYSAACEHETLRLTRRTFTNGTKHYAMQCAVCGKHVRTIGRSDSVVQTHVGAVPDFDEDLMGRYWDQRRDAASTRRDAERLERREAYQEYLSSPAWRQKRELRLRMDNGACQARLWCCTEMATEVHHLTYRHIGNEPLFDLRSVCSACHREITRMDRGQTADDEAA